MLLGKAPIAPFPALLYYRDRGWDYPFAIRPEYNQRRAGKARSPHSSHGSAIVNDAANHQSLIETQSLSRYFGGLKAVDGVDFHLQQGDFHSIIGPNGAGKTTF